MVDRAISGNYAQHSLKNGEIHRYSRQLLIPEIGVDGQERLLRGSALIVGAGGLGCPVAIYLASAGVGRLGIVDYDTIALDNLHRQVLHAESNVGGSKAQSIADAVQRVNSSVSVKVHEVQLCADNVLDIVRQYDVVVDCSDNAPTRYLVNDATVHLNKPLVSGSALKWEGQLAVYNCGEMCPCYRCLFPRPPPPSAMTSCSEGGVLGPVVGVIGSMQAIETLKIIANLKVAFAGAMFVYDGLNGVTRTVKLRGRQPDCVVCSAAARAAQQWPHTDYGQFCGVLACDKVQCVRLLDNTVKDRVEPKELQSVAMSGDTLLLDCRPAHEFAIAHLPNSISQ